MADEAVIVRREGGAAIIELNRPEAINAWNRDLGLGLKDAVLGVAEALRLIFRRARAEGAPTAEVADRIAEERIASAAHLRAMTPGTGAVPRA